MNQQEEDEDQVYWQEGDDEDLVYYQADSSAPEATFGSCLLAIVTVGLALLSMGGGIAASALAIDGLVQHQPDTMAITLRLAALPHSLLLLLGGFICQGMLAFALFTFQLHRQVRAILPGMALIVVITALLLLIRLTA